MKKNIQLLWILLFSSIQFGQAQIKNAYAGRKTRILFLLDGSGSMVAQMGKTDRWSASIRIMNKIVDTVRGIENLEIGLRVFGNNKPITMKDCYDTKLEVAFAPNNHKAFLARLKQVKPLGYTSITQSLLAAAKDFPADPAARNIIILITDGIEECNGDPCAVSAELQKKGVILRPFIIGLGTDEESFRKTYSCAGRYFNAQSEEELQKIFGVIINQVLNNTTAQFNLLDAQSVPRETNVPISIFDAGTGMLVENIVHTLNGKANPDTLFLDPIRKYNIVVHTLPQVVKNDVEIVAGRHNVIPVETPQGDLALKIGGITKYGRLQAIVRKAGTMETIIAQEFNTSLRLLTGDYDLEILSTPRMYLKNVNIKQNKTSTIEIPAPGQLQLTLGKDMIIEVFQLKDNKMEMVLNIDGTKTLQYFAMQPGEYKIVYRIKSETRTLYSKTKDFKITTGTSTILSI